MATTQRPSAPKTDKRSAARPTPAKAPPAKLSAMDRIRQSLKGRAPGSKSQQDLRFYKFPKGKDEVRIRILPPWEGAELPFKMVKKHYNLPDSDNSIVICAATFGEECEVCEVLAAYEDQLDVSDYASSASVHANIIVRKDPTQNVNPHLTHIMNGSRGMLDYLFGVFEDGEGQALTDAYEGRDIKVKREKANGKFIINPAFSGSPLADSEEEIAEILGNLYNLDKIKSFGSNDDDTMDKIRSAAASLKETIENKLLTLGGSGDQIEGGEEVSDDDTPYDDEAVEEIEETQEPEPAPPVKAAATKVRPGATAQPVRTAPVAAKPVQARPASPKPAAVTKAAPTAAVKPVAAKPVASSIEIPEGAPECFNDEGVYDRDRQECIDCQVEFNCYQALEARGVAPAIATE